MNINDFLTNFKGGTRLNRFVIQYQGNIGPDGTLSPSSTSGTGASTKTNTLTSIATDNSFPIHIRATKIPELTMGVIPVNYRGKTILFPGERQLNNWEIIVLDDVHTKDKNSHLHRAFMDWSRTISPTDGRLGVGNFTTATQYNSGTHGNIWKISQLPTDITDTTTSITPIRTFRMYNCWPKEIGPLQLDMSTDNAVNYFRVVLAYTHLDLPVS